MLQTLNTLVENDCRVKRIEPFCDTSSGFSITLVGRFQYQPLAKISIYENETKRTCSGTCYKDCHYTPDITHAKNFECVDGLWLENHSYPEEV